MADRTGVITFKGNPMTLTGNSLKVGDIAPDFKAVKTDMSECSLADLKGNVVLISSVPSLDTPVCDLQTKRFNAEAGKLGDKVKVVTVSLDLPFAQRRWCGANDAKHVITVSDYKHHQFGQNFGLLIKELALLTRSVLVVDKQGKITYCEVVGEVTKEPNYDAALAAAKAAL
ncbi:MAG: thiol peroxidase [Phycisphaeraceae bacterium]|nr:thiol peroxidase [Phycisphaeraceae bacterium]